MLIFLHPTYSRLEFKRLVYDITTTHTKTIPRISFRVCYFLYCTDFRLQLALTASL